MRKYTYMSPSFALGSTQTGLPGPMAGPIDLISWDLTLKGDNHQCKITCNHPYRSPDRFSAFLVGYPQNIGHQIGSDKPYLQWPDRLFGASPYERMMQHEGTAILAYRIPPEDEAPYINIFCPVPSPGPSGDGWILGDNQKGAYIALRPIGNYQWSEIREAGAVRFLASNPNQIDGWLLRIGDPCPGLIIEAAEAADLDSFESFCQLRVAAPLDLSLWPAQGRLAAATLKGHRLEMVYDGPHRVDGQTLDYASYPLYQAPGGRSPPRHRQASLQARHPIGRFGFWPRPIQSAYSHAGNRLDLVPKAVVSPSLRVRLRKVGLYRQTLPWALCGLYIYLSSRFGQFYNRPGLAPNRRSDRSCRPLQ